MSREEDSRRDSTGQREATWEKLQLKSGKKKARDDLRANGAELAGDLIFVEAEFAGRALGYQSIKLRLDSRQTVGKAGTERIGLAEHVSRLAGNQRATLGSQSGKLRIVRIEPDRHQSAAVDRVDSQMILEAL